MGIDTAKLKLLNELNIFDLIKKIVKTFTSSCSVWPNTLNMYIFCWKVIRVFSENKHKN